MSNNTHSLAFKAVRDDGTSLFIQPPLARKYVVGKTHRASKHIPMFLVTFYSDSSWDMATGADLYIKKVFLVRIPKKHLVKELPSYMYKFPTKGISQIVKFLKKHGYYLGGVGCTRLTVLEEVDLYRFKSADEAMRHYENKYGIKRISSAFLDFS